MRTEENYIDKLLLAWLSGTASEEEIVFIQKWVAKSEQNQELFETFEKVWAEKNAEPILVNADEKINEIWEKGMGEKVRPISPWKALWKFAAAILLLISISGSLYYFLNFYQDQPVEKAHPAFVVRENPSGQKTKLFLPDGSVVYLNSESKIEFIQGFSSHERRLLLTGEAFFEVAKNEEKPFVVESQGLETVALGTAFNVNAYAGEDELRVSLIEGKVEVRKIGEKEDRVTLNPGREIRLIQSTNEFQESSFDPVDVTGWKEGKLSFKNASFDQVKLKVERWFGVQINIRGDVPKDWHVTTVYDGQTLENILTDLQYSKKFTYEIKKENVTIQF